MQARLIVLLTRERSFRITAVSICFCALLLLLGTRGFARQAAPGQAISASELAKDNLDRVAASESQITMVLNANPGLFVELKRWIAKDAADRGQIVKESDPDRRGHSFVSLTNDHLHFRAAATLLLQRYGYLLPKANPDSEVGREQAALEQERIRELVSTQQAQAQQAQQNQLAKCSLSSGRADSNCPAAPNSAQKATVQTGTSNPSELPKDRDFGQLLTNPVPQPAAGNGSLLRTSANPLEAGSAPTIPGGSESELTLMPVSYDRTALPDYPDPPPQPSPSTPAPASLKATYSGEESLLDTNASETNSHRSPYSDIPSVYDIFAHSATALHCVNSIERFGEEVSSKSDLSFRERSPSISRPRRIMSWDRVMASPSISGVVFRSDWFAPLIMRGALRFQKSGRCWSMGRPLATCSSRCRDCCEPSSGMFRRTCPSPDCAHCGSTWWAM